MGDNDVRNDEDDDFGKIIKFDLFMVHSKPNKSKKKKLRIKFALKSRYKPKAEHILNEETKIEDIDKLNYIGLPLNVWLNGKDSIRSIIDKYMVHSKRFCYLHGCYRVKCNDEIVEISKRRWKHYVPFWEFLWKSPSDYLIFQVTLTYYYDGTKYTNAYSIIQ